MSEITDLKQKIEELERKIDATSSTELKLVFAQQQLELEKQKTYPLTAKKCNFVLMCNLLFLKKMQTSPINP